MPREPRCPYFGKPCLEHGCTHYVELRGRDPQTGKELADWMCVDLARLKIGLEGNKEIRQGAAATESFRNEMVNAATGFRALAAQRVRGLLRADEG